MTTLGTSGWWKLGVQMLAEGVAIFGEHLELCGMGGGEAVTRAPGATETSEAPTPSGRC